MMKEPAILKKVTTTFTDMEQNPTVAFDTTDQKTFYSYPAEGNDKVTFSIDLSGQPIAPRVTKVVLSDETVKAITKVVVVIITEDENGEEQSQTPIIIDDLSTNGDTINLGSVRAIRIDITFMSPDVNVIDVKIKAGLHVCKEEHGMKSFLYTLDNNRFRTNTTHITMYFLYCYSTDY